MPAIASGVDEIVFEVHLVGLLRPAASVEVGDGLDLLPFDLVQQRSEDPPGLGQLVGADKVHLRSDEHVQDQTLVGVRQPCLLVPGVVGHVQLGLLHVEANAGSFGHHLGVDGLSRLDPQDELVSFGHAMEDVAGNIAVLDSDFGLALVEGLSALEDEGDAVPALVVDADARGREGGSDGSGRNCRIVEISVPAVFVGSVRVTDVLSEHYVVEGNLLTGFQDLHFLVANVIRAEIVKKLYHILFYFGKGKEISSIF